MDAGDEADNGDGQAARIRRPVEASRLAAPPPSRPILESVIKPTSRP